MPWPSPMGNTGPHGDVAASARDRVSGRAPAKINLSLHVLGQREDGYHRLESLVAFAGVGDAVTLAPAATVSLTVTGPFAGALLDESDNLVLRAARALAELTGVREGARIVLSKALPVSAGIGGGSADAAATLRGLCQLWNVAPDAEALSRLALSLGADVPACLYARPAIVGGIGEILTPLPTLPSAWLVLVNPRVTVPTGQVFRALNKRFGQPREPWPKPPGSVEEMARWLEHERNDLEAPARTVAPTVNTALAEIDDTQGCLLTRMSGSGATCFGLYATPDAARAAAARISTAHPTWWVEATPLNT